VLVLKNEDRELMKVGIWAIVAIIAVVILVLFMMRSPVTGQYTSTLVYNQYEPHEACEINGCVWDAELQHGVFINPFSTPAAGCRCGLEIRYIPLIQRLY